MEIIGDSINPDRARFLIARFFVEFEFGHDFFSFSFNSFQRFFDRYGKEIARLRKYDKHSCRTSHIVQNECCRRDIFRKSFVIYHATTFLELPSRV